MLRQATYGSVRIGLYEPIKAQVSAALHGGAVPTGADGRPAPPTLVTKLLSGVLSGAIASGVFTPMDVVKVRMQAEVGGGVRADGAPAAGPRYRNVLHALRTIAAEEGRAGLYKGVSPTMQRAAVVAAVELASYDECKTLLVSALGMAPTGAPTHLAASLMAGFLCTLASSPLDVIKSRVMNQPVDAATGRGVRYSSTLDCLRKSVAAEGVASLWKGFWPNFGRIGPHCIITFMTIERLRNWAAERKAAAAAALTPERRAFADRVRLALPKRELACLQSIAAIYDVGSAQDVDWDVVGTLLQTLSELGVPLTCKVKADQINCNKNAGGSVNLPKPRGHHVILMTQHMVGDLRKLLPDLDFPLAAFNV